MKVRRPECDEQPCKPMDRNALANQHTMLTGIIGLPRWERMTGSAASACLRKSRSASPSSGWIGISRSPAFLGGAVVEFAG